MTCMKTQGNSFSEFLPLLPWKTRISISIFGAVTDFSRRSNGTINRGFLKLLDPIAKVPPRTTQGVKASDITVDSERNLWFRLFVPTKVPLDSKLPVVIYFHGGGFICFSPDSRQYDTLCRQFALKTPAVVVSVNYRLSPEHHCPAQYEDGFDVIKFLDKRILIDHFPPNADLSQCFLAGDSAGGNIAHNVARRVAEAESSEFNKVTVIGLIMLQPAFNGEEKTESQIRLKDAPFLSYEHTNFYFKAFLPQGEDLDHEAVNVFGPKSADISGLKNFPSTLVVIGGMDPLQDWQKRYYEGLKRYGKKAQLVEYPNGMHAFYLFPELPETSHMVMEFVGFIQKHGNPLK